MSLWDTFKSERIRRNAVDALAADSDEEGEEEEVVEGMNRRTSRKGSSKGFLSDG